MLFGMRVLCNFLILRVFGSFLGDEVVVNCNLAHLLCERDMR